MDIFSRFARDPACLVAIDAADGGAWRSPFRPQRSLKNFAGTPTVFADATAALNAVGTGDFDFTVVYNLKTTPSTTFGVFYNTSDFGMQVSNAPSYLLRACGVYVFVYQPAAPGAGSYRIRRIGSTIEFYLNGVLVGTKTSSAALSTSNISINLDGTVSSATLTGAASWSASIDQLCNADAIYPSAAPRNFATEPATWYAFDRAQKNIGTDDIEFEIEFYWNYDGAPATNGPIFAAGAPNSAVYLYYQSTGIITIASNLLGPPYVIMMLRTAGNQLPRGSHKVVCRVIGPSLWAQLDNEVAMTNKGIRQTGLTFFPQTSNFNGTIVRAQLKNLTIGKILWSYPSFEEKTRLITKTNVWTENGFFEAADASVAARIDTPLDLRGRVASYTSVVRFQPPAIFSSNSQKQELAGQGSSVGSNVAICALCYVRDSGEYKIQLSHEMSGGRRLLTASLGYPLDPTRTYTVVALIQVGTGQTTMSIYLDGILLKSSVTAEVPLGTASAQFTNFAINDNRLGAWTNFFGKFHNVLLFDRALKSSELQLLR